MNVKAMVKQWLEDNGYDGLYCDIGECGCSKDDLFPCYREGIASCKPGYKEACTKDNCPEGGGCAYHITSERPQ